MTPMVRGKGPAPSLPPRAVSVGIGGITIQQASEALAKVSRAATAASCYTMADSGNVEALDTFDSTPRSWVDRLPIERPHDPDRSHVRVRQHWWSRRCVCRTCEPPPDVAALEREVLDTFPEEWVAEACATFDREQELIATGHPGPPPSDRGQRQRV